MYDAASAFSPSPSPSPAPAPGSVSGGVKRPKTAWGLFLDEYKKARGNSGGIEKFNMLQKAASLEWKAMAPEEKAVSKRRDTTIYDEYNCILAIIFALFV
jgi:hypothetical protein